MQPDKKNILVCLGDNNLRGILRTIWGLCFQLDEVFTPFDVHILCSGSAAYYIKENLLHPVHGKLIRMIKEYELGGQVNLEDHHFHIFSDSSGVVYDLRSKEAYQIIANCIFNNIKELCSNEKNRIHASINSYNPTLAVFLSAAISLYGRPEDRLSETKVLSALVDHPDFYYPFRVPRNYFVLDPCSGNVSTLSCSMAEIFIENVPMTFLNSLLPVERINVLRDSLLYANDEEIVQPTHNTHTHTHTHTQWPDQVQP